MKAWCLLGLIGVFCSTWANANSCDEVKCFNIGTYNIKLLGNGGPADTPDEVSQIVNRISSEANLDVVVLQEINVKSSDWTDLLLPALEKAGYALTGFGAFGGADANRQQHVVILHRESSFTSIDQPEDIPMSTTYENGACNYDSVRPPTVAKFSVRGADLTLHLVGVHMKSQRPPDGIETCDDEIRTFQAKTIADYIGENEAEVDLTVVAGDFNAEFEAPEYEALRSSGMTSLVPSRCKRSSRYGCTYLVKRYAGVIDHIVVSQIAPEPIQDSARISTPEDIRDYLKTQSDHALVWASFSATPRE